MVERTQGGDSAGDWLAIGFTGDRRLARTGARAWWRQRLAGGIGEGGGVDGVGLW